MCFSLVGVRRFRGDARNLTSSHDGSERRTTMFFCPQSTVFLPRWTQGGPQSVSKSGDQSAVHLVNCNAIFSLVFEFSWRPYFSGRILDVMFTLFPCTHTHLRMYDHMVVLEYTRIESCLHFEIPASVLSLLTDLTVTPFCFSCWHSKWAIICAFTSVPGV